MQTCKYVEYVNLSFVFQQFTCPVLKIASAFIVSLSLALGLFFLIVIYVLQPHQVET